MDHFQLISNHFLNLPRPDVELGPPAGVADTTTLAAHDFDVDTRTGFMPPQPPLVRLSDQWEAWERALDDAQMRRLQLGRKPGITEDERNQSESWRAHIREMPIIPTSKLNRSELMLRRAHHVLSWTMHFYIHSLPPSPSSEIIIPAPITVPLLQVSAQLQLPPVVTYSDDVLYNWAFKSPQPSDPTDSAPLPAPALDNLRCLTLFTGTRDEEEFYLTSARMELRGVEALDLMRATMDELFVGDTIALRRITQYLHALGRIIDDLAALLMTVRDGCRPDVFYNDIRPWFCGADSSSEQRRWIFDGLEDNPNLVAPTELSGPSAAQSSLVHVLDIFLGVDEYSHSNSLTGHHSVKPSSSSSTTETSSSESDKSKVSFLTRMQTYMPRHHRNFLRHLSTAARPLRETISDSHDTELLEAYNDAVSSLKRFRDGHIRIVAMYIVGPSRKVADAERVESEELQAPLKGTGGTNLVKFLKDVRDRTAAAVMHPDSECL